MRRFITPRWLMVLSVFMVEIATALYLLTGHVVHIFH
jgi:hypothetical protein